MSRVRGFINRHRFILFVTLSLGLSYAWMFVEFGDQVLADPSVLSFYGLLFDHWYTMLPALPLTICLARPPDVF